MTEQLVQGPAFLAIYGAALGVLAVFRVLVKGGMLRGPSDDPSQALLRTLDAYEVAYLKQGEEGAVDAAVVALIHQDRLEYSSRVVSRVPQTGDLPGASVIEADRPAMEASVLEKLTEYDGLTPSELRKQCRSAAERLGARLRQRGLVLDPGQARLLKLAVNYALWGLFAAGAVRAVLGMLGGRPVMFLLGLLVVTFFLANKKVLFAHRTLRGDRALELLESENQALQHTAKSAPEQLSGQELALAYGLFGVAGAGALAYLAESAVREVLEEKAQFFDIGSGGSCGSSWSSCGSSCGGGCGGGGCGGCGG